MPPADLHHVATWINKARAANQKKNYSRAVSLCEKALKSQPGIPEAWFNMAIAFRGLDRRKRALSALNEAVLLVADAADAQNSIGLEYFHLGAESEAEACFRRAISLSPEHAKAHSNLGMLLDKHERLGEARQHFERALALDPVSAPIHLNMAGILTKLGDYEAARDHCLRAIEIDPAAGEVHNNLAIALEGMGQFEPAQAAAIAAIEFDPAYSGAHNNLALILSSMGDTAAAESSYLEALRIDPGYAEAHRNLSGIRNYQPGDPHIAQMRQLLDDAATRSDAERVQLSFALAKASDDIGETAAAFDYFSAGNALQKRLQGYHSDQDRIQFEQIRALYSGMESASIAAEPGALRPIFIVGMPRSGTTLVEQILSSHSEVHGAGERTYFNLLLNPILERSSRQPFSLDHDALLEIRNSYLARLRGLQSAAPVITDKMPLNFRWIGFIAAALPEARIVNLCRDPVATCWSIFRHFFATAGNGYAYDLDDIANYYKQYTALMAFWRSRLPGRVYDLDYESLTENQERETRRLLDYCGLGWEPRCLDFHANTRAVATASSNQVRQKLYSGSSRAWRKYARQLQPLVDALAQNDAGATVSGHPVR